jgi:hypothetical protein
MEEDEFDSRTRANMEVALDRACSRHPDGERHEVRKQIAEKIRQCARDGDVTLTGLTAAGESELPQKRNPQDVGDRESEMRPKHHVRAQIVQKASKSSKLE